MEEAATTKSTSEERMEEEGSHHHKMREGSTTVEERVVIDSPLLSLSGHTLSLFRGGFLSLFLSWFLQPLPLSCVTWFLTRLSLFFGGVPFFCACGSPLPCVGVGQSSLHPLPPLVGGGSALLLLVLLSSLSVCGCS